MNKSNKTKSWKNEENRGLKAHIMVLVFGRRRDNLSFEKKEMEQMMEILGHESSCSDAFNIPLRLKGREVSLRARGK